MAPLTLLLLDFEWAVCLLDLPLVIKLGMNSSSLEYVKLIESSSLSSMNPISLSLSVSINPDEGLTSSSSSSSSLELRLLELSESDNSSFSSSKLTA